MRPPGLWTAIVIIATEFLRGRVAPTRELVSYRMALGSGAMLGMMLVYRLTLGLLRRKPSFGFAIVQVLCPSR